VSAAKPARLITIPFSHFCEKARWALDRSKVPYVERGHLPLFAWIPALRAGGEKTVPTLVTDEGPVTDSTEILRWADRMTDGPLLFPPDVPDATMLEDDLDRDLGPATRLLAYSFLLPALRDRVGATKHVPKAEIVFAKLTAPMVRMLMKRRLKMDDGAVARARTRIDEIFEAMAGLLGDGRRYLTGDRFTAADLTFAALSSPVILPPQLADRIPMDDLPAEMAALVDDYRETPAGAFVMRLYAEDRGVVGGAAR